MYYSKVDTLKLKDIELKEFFMKKNIALLAAVSVIALSSAANALEFRPYVGAQYNITHINAKNLPANMDMNSYSLFVGTEYNKYFGTELFYQNTNSWHKIIDGNKVKADFDAYGLDAYAYLPLGCDQVIAPFATLGIAEYNFGGNNEDNGLGYRLGGGIQYHVTNNIAVRALGRYVWTDKLNGMDHLSEFSLGVKYVF